jgi:hypothetical protein
MTDISGRATGPGLGSSYQILLARAIGRQADETTFQEGTAHAE